jgi:hypothetical protein
MKNSLLVAGLVLGGLVASAQGTVIVSNTSAGTAGHVLDVDGTALSVAKAEFDVNYNGTVVPFDPTKAGKAPGFLAAGLFSANTVTIPGTTAGQVVSLTIEVWDKTTGSSYATATVRGSETLSAVTLGGGLLFAHDLKTYGWTGLQLSTVVTPEPSTYALAALGLGGLFFVSRRK